MREREVACLGLDNLIDEAVVQRLLRGHEKITIGVFLQPKANKTSKQMVVIRAVLMFVLKLTNKAGPSIMIGSKRCSGAHKRAKVARCNAQLTRVPHVLTLPTSPMIIPLVRNTERKKKKTHKQSLVEWEESKHPRTEVALFRHVFSPLQHSFSGEP